MTIDIASGMNYYFFWKTMGWFFNWDRWKLNFFSIHLIIYFIIISILLILGHISYMVVLNYIISYIHLKFDRLNFYWQEFVWVSINSNFKLQVFNQKLLISPSSIYFLIIPNNILYFVLEKIHHQVATQSLV